MTDRKFLRKSAALATSLVFMLSGSLGNLASAGEETVTEAVTEENPLPEETASAENENSEQPQNHSPKYMVRIIVESGDEGDVFRTGSIVKTLFGDVDIISEGLNAVAAETSGNLHDMLINRLDFEKDGYMFFESDGERYRLDSMECIGSLYTLHLTRCFDTLNTGDCDAVFSTFSSSDSLSEYTPEGTAMKAVPAKGWKAEAPYYFNLHGNLKARIVYDGSGYFMCIENGGEICRIAVEKTDYQIICSSKNDMALKINEAEGLRYRGFWLDSETIHAEFTAGEGFKERITGVMLTDTVTGAEFPMEVKGDGRNVTADISREVLDSSYTDGKKYVVSTETVPEKVITDGYILNNGSEEFLRTLEFDTSVTDEKAFVEIMPVLYENGLAKYIIDSYQCGGNTVTVDSKKLFDEDKLNSPIVLDYDSYEKVFYKLVVTESNASVSINYSNENNDKNIYPVKVLPLLDLLSINSLEEKRFMIIYNEIYRDNTMKSYSKLDKNFRVMLLPEDLHLIQAICTNSILYFENNEFHNMLQEPLYFYFDSYAPKTVLSNQEDNSLSDDKWAAGSYKFRLVCDDRETFDRAEGASDEVNEIYSRINGAFSPVTGIKVGDCEMKKENGKWTAAEESSRYTVSVTENSDTDFEIRVSLREKTERFEETLEVTVTDCCGNTSKPRKISLKIEQEPPVITSAKLEGAELYTHPTHGRCAAVGAGRREKPDRAWLDLEIKESVSGISRVAVAIDGRQTFYNYEDIVSGPEYRFQHQGDRYSFRIPVPAGTNYMKKVMVQVYDTASNKQWVYYNGDMTPDEESDDFAWVVMDADRPETQLVCSREPDYISKDKKQWYRTCPEFTVTASDEDKNGGFSSGIRYISFNVNGKEFKTDDILGNSRPVYTITGEHSASDSDIADIYCSDGSIRTKMTSVNLAETGGRISLEVRSYDAAANVSETKSAEFWTDPNPPQADSEFTVVNGTGSYRNFGTFLNRAAEIQVNVKEPENKPASGLKSAVISFNGEKYTCSLSDNMSGRASVVIPFDETKLKSFTGSAVITLTDNAGNTSESQALVSPLKSSVITFENIPPEIKDIPTDSEVKYTDNSGMEWYSDDVNIRIAADDSTSGKIYSGIASAALSVNGAVLHSDDFRKEKFMTASKEYEFLTSDSGNRDGRFDIIFRTEDNAGNPAEYRRSVSVDRTPPEIAGMSIDKQDIISMEKLEGVYSLPYGHFFRNSVGVTVYAKDENASSGLESITMTLHSPDGNTVRKMTVSGAELKFDSGLYSGDFVIPEGFRGYIVTEAQDNVKNRSGRFTHRGFITEDEARHSLTSSAEISLPDTQYSDRNGNPLYSGDIKAVISAVDSFSGIGLLQWHATEYGENKWRKIKAESDGKITGDSISDFEILSAENNLVLETEGSVALTEDKNAGNLRIKMTDNTGNTSEDSRQYSIDKKAPVISVSYGNTKSDSVSGIYSDQRTADISVSERNFDPGRISVTADGNESGVSFGGWTLVSGSEGTDSAVYRMQVTFSGNGEYVLRAEGTDMCDNKAQGYESEKFVIDRTAPLLEVVNSGAELKNGTYYNGTNTVTVKITEHNFDASRIRITGTMNGSEEDFPEMSGFTSSGDVHTAVLVFKDNADYTLHVEGEDAAGNPMESYSDAFTVDTMPPEIVFDGVEDRSANNGDVNLRVFIREENTDEKMIDVHFTGAVRGNLSSEAGVMERTDDGFVFTFSEFTKEKSTDDIYTAEVTVTDKADNRSQAELVFSVNRFGSTYVFDDKTLAIADTYVRKPVDIILHEINVDELKTDKTVVRVVKDNDSRELEKDRDYTVELNGGSGSWCDYRYVLKASCFSDDAAYRVIITTEDAAGNKNANSVEGKKAELKFGVDQTPPKCIPVNIEKNGSYRMDSLEAELVCEDNIMMDSCDVYLNGSKVTELTVSENSGYRFTMESSDQPQIVRVVLTDIAGNKSETVVDNVLVSSSFLRVVWHQTWIKVTLGFMAAAAIGFASSGKYRKKRR